MPRNQLGDVRAKQLAQLTMLSEQPLRHVSDGLPGLRCTEQVGQEPIVLRFTANDAVAMAAD